MRGRWQSEAGGACCGCCTKSSNRWMTLWTCSWYSRYESLLERKIRDSMLRMVDNGDGTQGDDEARWCIDANTDVRSAVVTGRSGNIMFALVIMVYHRGTYL